MHGMMRLDLSAPDYTTLSRRSQHLRRRLRPVPPGESIHLVLDSTGLSMVGAGEWAAAKHGGSGRRGWRKLHLGVDQSGVIRVHTLTEETGDDATTGLDLLTAVEGPLVRVTADAAYDTVAVYETAGARGATVVIPPARTANVSGHGPRSPGVDQSGGIRVHTLTEATGDDATTALDLLTAVEGPLVRVTADAAYDTVAVYETARARGATVVVPPARTANVSGHGLRSPARDRTIMLVKKLGRRRWKKASGYHRQSRVENAFLAPDRRTLPREVIEAALA